MSSIKFRFESIKMAAPEEVKWTHTKDALLSIETKIKCFVCKNIPVNPHILWCKHSFCKECLLTKTMCPKCNFPITPQEMVPDIMLNKLLQAMKVAAEISQCNSISFNGKEQENIKSKCQLKENINNDDLKNKNEKGNITSKQKKEEQEINNCSAKNSVAKVRNLRRNSKDKCSSSKSDERADKNVNDIHTAVHSLNKDVKVRTSRRNSKERSSSPIKGKERKPEKIVKEMQTPFASPQAVTKKNGDIMGTPKSNFSRKIHSSVLFSAKKANNVNKVNSKGETLLQIACRQGKLSLVQQLLREGAEPNVKDYANWTPLCDAVGSGNIEVVKALLDAGASVNTPSNLNTTALVEAIVRKDKAMVQLLMSYGADMNQRTALNNTALSLADEELRIVLLSYSNVPVQPPPRVVTTPRAVLIETLSQEQMEKVMELCKKFNLSLCKNFTEDVTHMVVEKSATKSCHSSTAVMLAILNGCSIVGMDWIIASLEAGRLVAVDGYEPTGTDDYPETNVFSKARLNKEQLLPRLFDGCHMSLQHDQPWPSQLKLDTVSLISAAGAVYQPRQCDPERVPSSESTVMFHTDPTGSLATVSHIILYQEGSHEPLLKYNMAHVKSFSVAWFLECIKTFTIPSMKSN